MSSKNELEIISRGSVDVLSQGPNTQGVNIDQHIALELLPPERPRYSDQASHGKEDDHHHHQEEEEEEEEGHIVPQYLETATRELAHSREQTESLLQRIEQLSSRIRSGLTLVGNNGTTVPTLPPLTAPITSNEDGDYPNDVMMTSSEEVELVKRCLPSSGSEKEEDGGMKGVQDGVDSPQVDEVDPKLVKALEKMKRLDKKLADLVMREREVKEQRRKLELQITGSYHTHSPHSPSDGVSPVFPTQVLEDLDPDFIQRNIEEVVMPVVLSESERLRLEQLLAQDDDLTEGDDCSSGALNAQSNGYRLTATAQTALKHIENQLQALKDTVVDEIGLASTRPTNYLASSVNSGQEAERLREIDQELAEFHS